MITVEEIKQKSLRRYEDYLRNIVIAGEHFFPLNIPGNKELERSKGVGAIQEQLLKLYKSDKSSTGFGFTLETATVSTKFGKIPVVKRILFTSETDYLKFIGKEKEADNYKRLLNLTVSEFGELKSVLEEKPQLLRDNLNKWKELLTVLRYFKQNPKPGLFIRELPVNVHTKFIESNKGVLTVLLSKLLGVHHNESGETFEDKFHLKSKHNLIRIRFLDPMLSPIGGHMEIGIAETEINKFRLNHRRTFIIENDITALTFPDLKESLAIFGRGYNLASLKEITWLRDSDLYYWSDIDVQGFEMLSQIRSYFPQVKSFLMDEPTFQKFADDSGKGTKSNNSAPLLLTEQETKLYLFLHGNNLRLEQEKIPQYWVEHTFALLFPKT
jgi:hypothetical protein